MSSEQCPHVVIPTVDMGISTQATAVSRMEERLATQANLRVMEFVARQKLDLHLTENRPMKTKTTWAGKQEEFLRWSMDKGYPDHLVNESKFLLFLEEQKGRKVQKRGRKRKSSISNDGSNELEDAREIGWNSLDGYVSAVMDLWRQQHRLGRFPENYPIPLRPPTIKAFLQNCKKDVVSKEHRVYTDRGIGTMADEIKANELGKLASYYWQKHNEEGLKQRSDYLMSFAMTSRGDNIRNLHFSEIGHAFYPEEGLNGAHLLRTVWRKTECYDA
jgi:hypothetical protein